MKVLLARPWAPDGVAVPPLGLGYLASALRPTHRVILRDGLRNPAEVAGLGEGLDAVCITVAGRDLAAVRRLALGAREASPGAAVLLGGPQVAALGPGVLGRVPEADFALVGEAEETLPPFLGALEERDPVPGWLGGIPGLLWRDGDSLRANPPPVPPDVEALTVAWDLMRPDQYPGRLSAGGEDYWPVAPLLTTRGCPDGCSFCAGAGTSGTRVRRRTIAAVVAEVGLLVSEYGVRGVTICDDNFTGDRGYVLTFCQEVARRFPALRWACPNGVRLDRLDGEVARAMAGAGCVGVSLGVDAGLTRARRGRTTREALAVLGAKVGQFLKAGIPVDAYALAGIPGESPEDFALKAEWMEAIPFRAATTAPYEAYG